VQDDRKKKYYDLIFAISGYISRGVKCPLLRVSFMTSVSSFDNVAAEPDGFDAPVYV
jgi:hypothetical protein